MRHAAVIALGLLLLGGSRAEGQATSAPADSAHLSGVVKDSIGKPLANVEVFIAGGAQSVRTTESGAFALASAGGTLDVWFRRIGSQTVRYLWVARAGEETRITVMLHALPHTLDPVVVRDRENRKLIGTAIVRGVVVDSGGTPIEDAEVQVVGANAAGATRANGGFVFDHLPSGSLIIRVRKFGYAPNVLSIQLEAGEDREFAIRLRALTGSLDPMVVQAESGYGDSQSAWDDFEKRRRWRTAGDIVLGPVDLQRYYSLPLDLAAKYILNGVDDLARLRQGYVVTSFGYTQRPSTSPTGELEDACILENGIRAVRRPLSAYTANEIEMLEVYPPNTELSGTVGARLDMFPQCRASGMQHPTYYVIWLKGGR